MSSESRLFHLLPALLVVAGGLALQVLHPTGTAREDLRADPAAASGEGFALAILGGYRAVAADVLWLRANVAWEARDAARTEALLRAAVAADPRVEHFRINAARIIAFDFPTWSARLDEPAAVRAGRHRLHAERAIELLQDGLKRTGPSAACWIEMGRIADQVLGARVRAADYYGTAAEILGAPYFAGRLRVELLVAEGHLVEARDWLRDWLPRLPADDPAAQRGRMRARLAELEQSLAAR